MLPIIVDVLVMSSRKEKMMKYKTTVVTEISQNGFRFSRPLTENNNGIRETRLFLASLLRGAPSDDFPSAVVSDETMLESVPPSMDLLPFTAPSKSGFSRSPHITENQVGAVFPTGKRKWLDYMASLAQLPGRTLAGPARSAKLRAAAGL